MSSDYFFSAVFLRSLYPFAPIRQSLLLKTQKVLRQQSTAAVPIPGSTDDKHSLFTFAATYIQNIHDNSRTFVSNPNNPNKSTPTPPQYPGANNGGGGRYKPGGLELAAAASTTTPAPPASVPPASTASTNSGPNPYQHEGKTIYTRAIRALPGDRSLED
jgi:hypothetical protein